MPQAYSLSNWKEMDREMKTNSVGKVSRSFVTAMIDPSYNSIASQQSTFSSDELMTAMILETPRTHSINWYREYYKLDGSLYYFKNYVDLFYRHGLLIRENTGAYDVWGMEPHKTSVILNIISWQNRKNHIRVDDSIKGEYLPVFNYEFKKCFEDEWQKNYQDMQSQLETNENGTAYRNSYSRKQFKINEHQMEISTTYKKRIEWLKSLTSDFFS